MVKGLKNAFFKHISSLPLWIFTLYLQFFFFTRGLCHSQYLEVAEKNVEYFCWLKLVSRHTYSQIDGSIFFFTNSLPLRGVWGVNPYDQLDRSLYVVVFWPLPLQNLKAEAWHWAKVSIYVLDLLFNGLTELKYIFTGVGSILTLCRTSLKSN